MCTRCKHKDNSEYISTFMLKHTVTRRHQKTSLHTNPLMYVHYLIFMVVTK
jgi:hypothetical protein